jgi:hypothetical protein
MHLSTWQQIVTGLFFSERACKGRTVSRAEDFYDYLLPARRVDGCPGLFGMVTLLQVAPLPLLCTVTIGRYWVLSLPAAKLGDCEYAGLVKAVRITCSTRIHKYPA